MVIQRRNADADFPWEGRLSASVQFGGEGLPESRRFGAKDSRLVGLAGSATADQNLRQ